MRYSSLLFIYLTFCLFGCSISENKSTVYFNAHIYSQDKNRNIYEAMAVKENKIIELGTKEEIISKYPKARQIDLENRYVYPSFYDAHGHFYYLGRSLFSVDLTGTNSWEEVIERCKAFRSASKLPFLLGRGWDQNNWKNKDFPTNKALNEAFPNIPVFLVRIDGHASIVNDYLLGQAGVDHTTIVDGGELLKINNKLTGVLIDNASKFVEEKLPQPSRETQINYLKAAEKQCFKYGVTSVADAGLKPDIIELIDSLQRTGELKMRVYAMIEGTLDNVKRYTKLPIKKTDKLNVRSFKLYSDGALGSRGAYLLENYEDKQDTRGLLLNSEEQLEQIVKLVSNSAYQLNTHCIGDGANHIVLKLYAKYLQQNNDRRWRIEHAQIVHPDDYQYFKMFNIIPSIQPTHATSDGYWAAKRIGQKRLTYAYPLKEMLNYTPHVALGTDFPVEKVNPLYTFYSAVTRKNPEDKLSKPFLYKQAISREEALRGMTLGGAYAAFEEGEKGSLEAGKFADFIVMDVDLMSTDIEVIKSKQVTETYVDGKRVF